ncbi:hypothetical protein LLB_0023 [Legionella longbeachae D-4968]|nr:hypothetical protein LLB_0023 [Legionella longbeachae D-4968]
MCLHRSASSEALGLVRSGFGIFSFHNETLSTMDSWIASAK